MTMHGDNDQEMSMDEILASIRRYVSSDEPVEKQRSAQRPAAAATQTSTRANAEPARVQAELMRTNAEPAARSNTREAYSNDASLRSAPLHEFLQKAPMMTTSGLTNGNATDSDVVRLERPSQRADGGSEASNTRSVDAGSGTSGASYTGTGQGMTSARSDYAGAGYAGSAAGTASTGSPHTGSDQTTSNAAFAKGSTYAGLSQPVNTASAHEGFSHTGSGREASGSGSLHTVSGRATSDTRSPSMVSGQADYVDSHASNTPAEPRTAPHSTGVDTSRSVDSMVSDSVLATTMASFARLNDAINQAPAATQSKNQTSSMDTPNKLTLDQLFYDLARPMISQWLEAHLPKMVENMVSVEIARIMQGAKRDQ